MQDKVAMEVGKDLSVRKQKVMAQRMRRSEKWSREQGSGWIPVNGKVVSVTLLTEQEVSQCLPSTEKKKNL